MRHMFSDWLPSLEPDGRCLHYACKYCAVRIDAAVIICAEQDDSALREALPDRLIIGLSRLPDGFREYSDGRSYAALTGLPACTAREIMR